MNNKFFSQINVILHPMKNKMSKLKMIIFACMIIIPGILLAQPGGFDDDVTDNPVPFDGGVTPANSSRSWLRNKKGSWPEEGCTGLSNNRFYLQKNR